MAILHQPSVLICMFALQIFESFCPSDFDTKIDNNNDGLLIFFLAFKCYSFEVKLLEKRSPSPAPTY